ncbi:MAG: hypothetical protein P8Y10_06100 [Gemmatimonadales bacterium]
MHDLVRSRFSRIIAVLLTLTALVACQRWTTVESPIASTVENNDPGRVRVTTTDGRIMELDSPTVQGDSLTGSIVGEQQPIVAIGEIDKLEFRESNIGLTVLSIAGAAAIVVAIVLATNPVNENP